MQSATKTGKAESPFFIGVSQRVIYKPDEIYAAVCACSTEMTCRWEKIVSNTE